MAASSSSFIGLRALVVGGTSGIGHGIALALADAKMAVSIAGRDEARGNEIVSELSKRGGSGHDFLQVDASRLANVASCAQTFLSRHKQLDVLVLTQGRASMQGFTPTEDGLDIKMALHYYSRMAFVECLLPALRQSRSPRVLAVLSGGVHSAYGHYATDPTLKDHFSLKNCADAAGFYLDLTLDTYSRDTSNGHIAFYHAMPGFVNTRWGTELPWAVRMVTRCLQPLGRTPEKCGQYLTGPLLKPDAKPGFHILNQNGEEKGTVTRLHSDEARAVIWRHTQEVFERAGVKALSL